MKRFRFVRVDDRLLHGQVAIGWHEALAPAAFWIVDEPVASDPFSRAIYEAAVPEGTRLEIVAPARFGDALERAGSLEATVLLVRSLAVLRDLCEGGFRPESVNLGGVHPHPGSRRVLDYLHLSSDDVRAARWLHARGIELFAQDLPSSPRHEIATLLQAAEGSR